MHTHTPSEALAANIGGLTADALLALADTERRLAQRRHHARGGRRAIDRMAATPAEIDRLARTLRAEWEQAQ